jgi:beta-barrel assembly-enhancing protease
MSPQNRGLLWLGATLALGIALAEGTPYAVAHIPWSAEVWLARWLNTGFEPQACSAGPELAQTALAQVVARLHPIYPTDAAFPVHVSIVSGDVVNAFAGLAGNIRVFSGLLDEAESPEEFAGVLAHEIAHVRYRHVLRGTFVNLLTRAILGQVFDSSDDATGSLASLFLNLRFSQEQETEADAGAIERLRDAHIDPAALAAFFERQNQKGSNVPAFMSSHPSNEARAAAMRASSVGPFLPILDAAQWQALKRVCQK